MKSFFSDQTKSRLEHHTTILLQYYIHKISGQYSPHLFFLQKVNTANLAFFIPKRYLLVEQSHEVFDIIYNAVFIPLWTFKGF